MGELGATKRTAPCSTRTSISAKTRKSSATHRRLRRSNGSPDFSTGSTPCRAKKLRNWTDAGMNIADESYINACSGIVNRGCYNPPCGGNPMDGGKERAANFATVMKALGLGK